MDLENSLRKLSESDELNTKLRDETIARMEEAAPSGRRIRLRRPAVVAVVLVLVLGLATVGYATGLLSPSTLDAFKEGLGDSEEQELLIEKLGEPLDISVSKQGITVTAEAMLNDGKCLAILFKVSRDNGEPLLPADVEGLTGVIFSSGGGKVGPYYHVEQKDRLMPFLTYEPGDLEGYFMHVIGLKDEALTDGCIYYLSLGSLAAWYDHYPWVDRLTYRDIFWKFEIPISPACEYKEFAKETIFQKNGEEFRIDAVRVSPLSVTVDYTVLSDSPSNRQIIIPGEHFTSLENGDYTVDYQQDAFTDNINLALRLKDGSTIDLSTFMNGDVLNPMGYVEINEEDDIFVVHRAAVLSEITAFEDMDCVIFNDVEYKIND